MRGAIDEAAYATLLRWSARETARRFRDGDLAGESRAWGRLRAAVLGELDAEPRMVADIAGRLRKDKGNVTCVLRRLEADGLAARAGKATNPNGQPVTLWVRRSDT